MQSSLDSGGSLRQITSVLTLYNTQVTLPKPPDAPQRRRPLSSPARSTIPRNCVIYCRDCWMRRHAGLEMIPRVNISGPARSPDGTAGPAVAAQVDTILSVRQGCHSDPATTTGAWLVTQGEPHARILPDTRAVYHRADDDLPGSCGRIFRQRRPDGAGGGGDRYQPGAPANRVFSRSDRPGTWIRVAAIGKDGRGFGPESTRTGPDSHFHLTGRGPN